MIINRCMTTSRLRFPDSQNKRRNEFYATVISQNTRNIVIRKIVQIHLFTLFCEVAAFTCGRYKALQVIDNIIKYHSCVSKKLFWAFQHLRDYWKATPLFIFNGCFIPVLIIGSEIREKDHVCIFPQPWVEETSKIECGICL